MVKQYSKKSFKKSSTKSKKSKTLKKHPKRKSYSKNMRGGDDGRYVMPPSYYGNGTSGYYAPGSPELSPSADQVSVSRGTVWAGGQYAGPNLYPMQGGNCGCNSKRNYKNKSRKMKGGGYITKANELKGRNSYFGSSADIWFRREMAKKAAKEKKIKELLRQKAAKKAAQALLPPSRISKFTRRVKTFFNPKKQSYKTSSTA